MTMIHPVVYNRVNQSATLDRVISYQFAENARGACRQRGFGSMASGPLSPESDYFLNCFEHVLAAGALLHDALHLSVQ